MRDDRSRSLSDRRRVVAVLLPVLLVACRAPLGDVVVDRVVDATHGAVVSVEANASCIGAEVLARGGNAIDAAVATAFALAVTWPEAGNIGGGGFMLVRHADGGATFIDYRETAPAAAGPGLFLDASGRVDPVRVRLGYLPVGVPGTPAGLFLAHQRYGSLPWHELVEPAIELAEDGFVIDEALERSIAAHASELAECPVAASVYLNEDGVPRRAGDRLVQRDLAWSLEQIADGGSEAFYEGEVARRIVADSDERGGILARADFAAYDAVERAPLVGEYRGATILAGSPPTSGGVVLIESLNQLEGFSIGNLPPGSAAELHLIAEVQRRSFLDRARFLGDPDFVDNPVADLLDKERAAAWRDGIDIDRATPSDELAGDLDGTLPPEGESTTHFCVVDRFGTAVSNTYTLEESFGAKTMARGTGILLNNEMHDFNVTPGRSTRAGRIGTSPNWIAPRKRMLSSMCPVIVTQHGELRLVAGSPGGRTIPSTVLRVVTAVIDHDFAPADAIALGRIHHGLYPDRIDVERRVDAGVKSSLEAMGHELRDRDHQGDCHAIGLDRTRGIRVATADDRRAGAAAAVAPR